MEHSVLAHTEVELIRLSLAFLDTSRVYCSGLIWMDGDIRINISLLSLQHHIVKSLVHLLLHTIIYCSVQPFKSVFSVQ